MNLSVDQELVPVNSTRKNTMKVSLPMLLVMVAAMLSPLAGKAQGSAPTWPIKPITLIVDAAPGSSNDAFARAVGKRLTDTLGQPVVIDNKPSGGGIIANSLVARAAPDGYTLVLLSTTFTTVAATRASLPYDPIKGFKPVARLATGPMLVTVAADSPYKTLGDLVSAAKAQPGKLNYGTSGVGGINHFAAELLMSAADVKMTQVPYKGISLAITDMIGGQVQVVVASAASMLPHMASGRVRALAVTTGERSPIVPDLPSIEQAGYKGSASELWWGVLAPAGTPAAVVDRLNTEINKLVIAPDMKAFFLRSGAEPAPMKPADFEQFIAAEIIRWKRIAATAGIQAD
jgi:tripartite-type tricarboxylate transporter receptor subunit TctC